jgi:hypothetical protein
MHTFMRRSGAVLTSAGVTAALTLLTPVAAGAAVHAEYAASGTADADYTGPSVTGTCALASGDDDVQSSPSTLTHGTKHHSVNLDATFASSDNAADTVRVRGHASTDFSLKRKHKDMTSFGLAVGGSVKVTHTMSNSACDGEGFVGGVFAIKFTEHHKGYFTLTRDTKKAGSVSELFLVNVHTEKLVTLDIYAGTKSHQTSRALLKPGTYLVEIAQAGLSTGTEGIVLKSGRPVTAKVARTVHLQGQFKVKH